MGDGRATSDQVAEWAGMVLLAVALLFGGGPRGVGDLVVHLAAVPALVLGVLRWRQVHPNRLQALTLGWLLASGLIAALYLVPWPASLWATAAPRGALLQELRGAGSVPSVLPMTLDTWGSVRALLAFGTFASAWLLVSTLGHDARRRLLMLALLIATATALLGFAQAAAGTHSSLRAYAYHHPIGAIGLFANRNHFASLMGMLLPVALAFAFRAQRRQGLGGAALWYAVAVALLLAAALSFSRTGIVLTLLAGVAAVLVLPLSGTAGAQRSKALLPLAALALAAVGVAIYAWDGIAHRLTQDPADDLRWQYLEYGADLVRAYLPWGSGLGSFRDVYAPLEPVAAMVHVHALNAHNDLLQVVVELGVPGALLLFAFAVIVFAALGKSLIERRATGAIMPAAAMGMLVPLAHSLVDYPLRTLSVATVLAVLLAVSVANPATDRMT